MNNFPAIRHLSENENVLAEKENVLVLYDRTALFSSLASSIFVLNAKVVRTDVPIPWRFFFKLSSVLTYYRSNRTKKYCFFQVQLHVIQFVETNTISVTWTTKRRSVVFNSPVYNLCI